MKIVGSINTKVISYDEKKVRDFSEQRFIKKHGGYINNDKEMSKKIIESIYTILEIKENKEKKIE